MKVDQSRILWHFYNISDYKMQLRNPIFFSFLVLFIHIHNQKCRREKSSFFFFLLFFFFRSRQIKNFLFQILYTLFNTREKWKVALFFFWLRRFNAVMFFLISFGWHVAASFAFLVAILNPNWITIQTVTTTGIVNVQRDIFYVCYVVGQDATYQTTQCASIINLDSSITSTIWKYSNYKIVFILYY